MTNEEILRELETIRRTSIYDGYHEWCYTIIELDNVINSIKENLKTK